MRLKLAALVLVIAGCGVAFRCLGIDLTAISPDRVRELVLSFGAFAPAVYLLIYGQPFIPLPASMMTAVGGLAFGPLWGMCAALTGATARACSQFAIARLFGQDTITKLLKGRIAALNQKISNGGFKAVLLIRLIPNFPFDVQNYGLGFSQVRFLPYVTATLLGVLPGSVAFVYLGYSLTDPKHLWKLVLAILLIIGLTWMQQAWARRGRVHPKAP